MKFNESQLEQSSLPLRNDNDRWGVSPAYDLLNVAIVNPEHKEKLALTLASKKKKLGLVQFLYPGAKLGLNNK